MDQNVEAEVGLLRPATAGTAAAALTGDLALLQAMLDVETAWVGVLEAHGLAPEGTEKVVAEHADARDYDLVAIASAGGRSGNPLIPTLAAVRDRVHASSPAAAAWVHASLTSQDVIDTALLRLAAATGACAAADLRRAATSLIRCSDVHRQTLAVARSLTQPALPTTFGLKAAGWVDLIVTAGAHLDAELASLPLQSGGAAGTRAALVELCEAAGSSARPFELLADLAGRLGLAAGDGWQTNRLVVTRLGAALTDVAVVAGRIAADTLLLGRPEIGEMTERRAGGAGGSSAMPHKRNPTLGVLLRGLAIEAPHLQAQLTSAAALAVDERSDGAWHAEWAALRVLLRDAGAAAELLAELADGLEIHRGRMRANLDAAGDVLLGERLVVRVADRFPGGADEVRGIVAEAVRDGVTLRTVVRSRLTVHELPDDELDAILDPARYLGDAEPIRRALVERAETWVRR